ncbi:hypothetical protein [Janthinobacterium sp. ROICE36]|uniref:hypothetical protein n=1 Tax=Janthinobacterium sp. ROICE36 TaxID=2048670 RepID=UPI0011AF880F|nr:hypothetical protein [Janthinobacterium sp. ROICE36]
MAPPFQRFYQRSYQNDSIAQQSTLVGWNKETVYKTTAVSGSAGARELIQINKTANRKYILRAALDGMRAPRLRCFFI